MSDKAKQYSTGGQACTSVATSGAADLLLVAGAGRLCKVFINTAGTTLLRFWDSATTSGAAGAVPVYTAAQTTTAGAVYDVQAPFANGLVVSRAANAPGFTVSWTSDTAYGR